MNYYIKRGIEEQLLPFLERKEVLAIVGPRQAGKTTFLLHLKDILEKKGKQVFYLTFEKRTDLKLFQDTIEDFKELYKNYKILLIDEFHYAKNGGQKLKYLYDTTNIKFIISGSSSLELAFQTGKYMVGRLMTFKLLPFSFKEVLSFKNPEIHKLISQKKIDLLKGENIKELIFGSIINQTLEKHFEEYLIFGGYPEVALAKTEEEKRKILESILENYLLKDIKNLLILATETELIKLVKFLATQIGNLLEYKELSGASGLNFEKLKKHLNILEQTYIITLLRPFFTNKRIELTKNPKVYFLDSGFRNFALENFSKFDSRQDVGSLVENFVFRALLEKYGSLDNIHFWRTKSKAEVDFILESGGQIIPIEVKYSKNPTPGKSLYSFIEKFSPSRAFVLTNDYSAETVINTTKIIFMPVYYL